MILPDVNLLIFAHNRGAPQHVSAREWWESVLVGEELVGLPWVTILGFVRVITNRAVFGNPMPVEDAVASVEAWVSLPHVRILHPSGAHGSLLFGLLRSIGTAGNLTTDAHLAALAIEHGCVLYSTDADFSRFPDLIWKNPLK